MTRQQRACAWLATAFWVVMCFMLGVFAFSGTAHAETFKAQAEDNWVKLFTDLPCREEAVLRRAAQGTRGFLRAGSAYTQGTQFSMCWYQVGEMVWMFYPDGDVGRWPIHMFKQEPEV